MKTILLPGCLFLACMVLISCNAGTHARGVFSDYAVSQQEQDVSLDTYVDYLDKNQIIIDANDADTPVYVFDWDVQEELVERPLPDVLYPEAEDNEADAQADEHIMPDIDQTQLSDNDNSLKIYTPAFETTAHILLTDETLLRLTKDKKMYVHTFNPNGYPPIAHEYEFPILFNESYNLLGRKVVRTGTGDLYLLNTEDPYTPFIEKEIAGVPENSAIAVSGDLLAAISNKTLRLCRISNDFEVSLLDEITFPVYIQSITIKEQVLYVLLRQYSNLLVYQFDAEKGLLLKKTWFSHTNMQPIQLVLQDTKAFLFSQGRDLTLLDITDPLIPTLIGSLPDTSWGTYLLPFTETLLLYGNGLLQLFENKKDNSLPVAKGKLLTPYSNALYVSADTQAAYGYGSNRGWFGVSIEQAEAPELLFTAFPLYWPALVAANSRHYFIYGDNNTKRLDIYDSSSPGSLKKRGALWLMDAPVRILAEGDQVYALYSDHLSVIDTENPSIAFEIASLKVGSANTEIISSQQRLLISSENNLYVLSLLSGLPQLVAHYQSVGKISALTTDEDVIMFNDALEGMTLLTITESNKITKEYSISSPVLTLGSMLLSGTTAYCWYNNGLKIYDISDRKNPQLTSSLVFFSQNKISGMRKIKNDILLIDEAGLGYLVDVSAPKPLLKEEKLLLCNNFIDYAVFDTRVYAVSGECGLKIYDFADF